MNPEYTTVSRMKKEKNASLQVFCRIENNDDEKSRLGGVSFLDRARVREKSII